MPLRRGTETSNRVVSGSESPLLFILLLFVIVLGRSSTRTIGRSESLVGDLPGVLVSLPLLLVLLLMLQGDRRRVLRFGCGCVRSPALMAVLLSAFYRRRCTPESWKRATSGPGPCWSNFPRSCGWLWAWFCPFRDPIPRDERK